MSSSPENEKPRVILFLYQELAGYTLACLKEFVSQGGVTVHLVRWEVNPVAPFRFDPVPGIVDYLRSSFTDEGLVRFAEALQPDIVFCGGWVDKTYLKVVRALRGKSSAILALDNHWRGTLRQRLLTRMASLWLPRMFRWVWIPGLPQYEFVRRLGFPASSIRLGFYSCDQKRFSISGNDAGEAKFRHRFLFVGRITKEKGIPELLQAFERFSATDTQDWELVLVGKGDLSGTIPVHSRIRHIPFLQPDELSILAREGGVFILPSRYEAWGVVLHEFATAGFPLVCSFGVGAGFTFLKNGYNGVFHRAGDMESVLQAMNAIANRSDAELIEMGRRSHEQSQAISPVTWACELREMLRADSEAKNS